METCFFNVFIFTFILLGPPTVIGAIDGVVENMCGKTLLPDQFWKSPYILLSKIENSVFLKINCCCSLTCVTQKTTLQDNQ